jgi:hypothetical protein
MSASDFLDLIRNITHADPRVRERGADEATDSPNAYAATDVASLATVLAAAAATEQDAATLEAQLHAILELASTGHVQVAHVAHVREIEVTKFSREIQEYVTDLLEE